MKVGQRNIDNIWKTLLLNMEFVKISNWVVSELIKIKRFDKALLYTIIVLYIYNNSLKLIHETDPFHYPHKNVNSMIIIDLEEYQQNQNYKIQF